MADSGIGVKDETRGEARVLSPEGDIDLNASPALREVVRGVLESGGAKVVVVDLSMVDYMDSSGVATLVDAMRSARKAGVRLWLSSLGPQVRSIFEIARLDRVFDIASTADEAIERSGGEDG
ncbi:MAG: STAS domain-containing protein [Planctomycetota bacterium]